jgi:hypothetical protein
MSLRHAAALDLSPRLDDPALREVLALAVGDPTPEKINHVCETYRAARESKILGYSKEDRDIVARVGVEITGPGEATIQHIAVVPTMRRLAGC